MSAAEIAGIVLLTLKVSAVATALILVPGVALGYVLARKRFPGRKLLQAVVSLPMVLPPVAVGLLLLTALSRRSPLGAAAESLLGHPLLLTWQAAAIASAVMSFPLLVMGAQQGFDSVPKRLEQVAASLGATRWRTFRRITLPLAARGILYGLVFALARGLGEFGATTLVAGHIPGETETLSLAIYARIERFEDGPALVLSLVSIAIALVFTGVAEAFLGRRR
jgi:molybdate transport system permease protein